MTDKLTPEQQAEKYADQTDDNDPVSICAIKRAGFLAGYRAALAEPAAATLSDEERQAFRTALSPYHDNNHVTIVMNIERHIESLLSARLSAARRDALEERICSWAQDEHYEGWDTACGNRYVINDGTPAENGMRFCCYCGGQLSAT